MLTGLSSSAEDGSVDIHGNPPSKKKTGNWKACPFILGKPKIVKITFLFSCFINFVLSSKSVVSMQETNAVND